MKKPRKLKRFKFKLVINNIKRHVIALKICFLQGFTVILNIGEISKFIKISESILD
jgi:hypothetical protein